MKLSPLVSDGALALLLPAAAAVAPSDAQPELEEGRSLRKLKYKQGLFTPQQSGLFTPQQSVRGRHGIDQSRNVFAVDPEATVPTKEQLGTDSTDGPTAKIVDGTEVDPRRKYKFFVSIGGCGASLVAPNVLLSAAHCAGIQGPAVLGLHMNTVDGANEFEHVEIIPFAQSTTHPQYNGNTENNDFWVIQLQHDSVLYKDEIIQLDAPTGDDYELTSGVDLTVVGMGALASGGSFPNVLQEVEVDYMTNAECCSGTDYPCSEITDNMMCARRLGKDSCQGDSGGPIFDTKTRRQVGIVSWGYGCADFDAPGGEKFVCSRCCAPQHYVIIDSLSAEPHHQVYSRVSAGYDWITQQISAYNSNGNNPPPQKVAGQRYDNPEGFYDRDGPEYSCLWYAISSNCAQYGSQYANGGLTANDACAACGGGEIFSGEPTTGSPSAIPSKAPSPNSATPTMPSPTESPSATPTMAPSGGENTSLRTQACGVPNRCNSVGGDKVTVSKTASGAVRCCRDPSHGGDWAYKCISIPDVWGESNMQVIPEGINASSGGCVAETDFAGAIETCQANDARLCTPEEMLDQCTKGTGCQFNNVHLWVAIASGDACSTDSECESGSCNGGTCVPTSSPTAKPVTGSPTTSPTSSPSSKPTVAPSASPSASPVTTGPTTSPTSSPSSKPTVSPSVSPSARPVTSSPITTSPSISPTPKPVTESPSATPTANPTKSPSSSPIATPTTGSPTISPSKNVRPGFRLLVFLQSEVLQFIFPTSFLATNQPTGSPKTGSPSSSPVSKSPSSSPVTSSPSSSPSANPTTLSPTLQPTQSPSASPTSQPTTSAPSGGENTSLRTQACGVPNRCNSVGGDKVTVSKTASGAVRCCRDPSHGGDWDYKCISIPDVSGESNMQVIPEGINASSNGCVAETDFAGAIETCQANDARLCTPEEMLDRCTRSTGCQFNKVHLWVAIASGDDCSTDPDCASGSCNDGKCS
ncbi:hypothetical protein THAOC_36558 [Thalassiosira oceanica]|uniref:Peptidase S1 domain-containing protein n=1 Tax=Thalassiosira oceanica TaxID=159749 RepID=K0R1P5_THAOC|nr:hypothetical protein THAOC_36558 [Thalassiosira oceanica]|eukprot:EJK44869.1 hypothetical protein THAOC_36558 [Thalassiosira oceanica]